MLGDFNEARRRLSQLEQTQNISWQASFDYYNAESRTAFEFLSRIGNADSRYLGPALEQRMLELEKDETFQEWLAKRRTTRTEDSQ
jgi:hypothetical protein